MGGSRDDPKSVERGEIQRKCRALLLRVVCEFPWGFSNHCDFCDELGFVWGPLPFHESDAGVVP